MASINTLHSFTEVQIVLSKKVRRFLDDKHHRLKSEMRKILRKETRQFLSRVEWKIDERTLHKLPQEVLSVYLELVDCVCEAYDPDESVRILYPSVSLLRKNQTLVIVMDAMKDNAVNKRHAVPAIHSLH